MAPTIVPVSVSPATEVKVKTIRLANPSPVSRIEFQVDKTATVEVLYSGGTTGRKVFKNSFKDSFNHGPRDESQRASCFTPVCLSEHLSVRLSVRRTILKFV